LLLAADRGARVVHRVHQLTGEPLPHRFARTLARGLDDPAHRERAAAIRADLDGDLVGCAANAARLDLDERRRVLHRGLEDLDRGLPRRLLRALNGVVDDALGGRALAVPHHLVDELLDRHVGELAVADLDPLGGTRSTRHYLGARFLAFGFFAPYRLRPWARSLTPAVSRVPRMMWYFTDGRSGTRPPRTRTTECSWRLWPMPGMYAVTSMWLVRRTRAIFRSAEFGFFGVIVRTIVQTPRF